jgi:hypothetical protein
MQLSRDLLKKQFQEKGGCSGVRALLVANRVKRYRLIDIPPSRIQVWVTPWTPPNLMEGTFDTRDQQGLNRQIIDPWHALKGSGRLGAFGSWLLSKLVQRAMKKKLQSTH